MQTRLADRFAMLRERNEGALVAYIAAGDPSLHHTAELSFALDRAGVDVLELGMPFSDPVADGPTIQAACQRAIAAGATPEAVLRTVHRIRNRIPDLPIVIMTYLNLVHRYGYKRFACEASSAGVDAVLVSDLPVHAAEDWLRECKACDLDAVFLVAPNSRPETIARVGEVSTGFVYCVSRAGTTGARSALPEDLPEFLERTRRHTDRPLCVGFGISTPDQVAAVARLADGAIVGSALIDTIASSAEEQRVEAAYEFARRLKEATRRDA